MSFQLPNLPYNFEALEPHIDSKTMQIHHGKHHAGYTNKLNAALEGTDMEGKAIEDILKNLDVNDNAVRNNGGGYFNHCLFWEIMGPNCGGEPKGELAYAIEKNFGSFDEFKSEFSAAAGTRFGSGWAWLCVHEGGKVEVCATPNQDNPLMPKVGCGGFPILGIDVWEHAYYIDYRNARPKYLEGFWNLVNWEFAAANFAA